ncbi:helix-turn-helix domain-containing protein [Pseudogracilibacillus auburnensis]|uniref:helix-turn-helix domain-containing protein n=1 Tax=Pseudogracilibacillus auburnensis TaxID=1494959 RepID=UPI001A95B92E|nr:helix-turn-helix transcriptional regulator [Pseudogracilibacillus auburnensis]MBO1005646.1 helix-turn-helix transcriptional regulator [Pseudogracilibacillus auburnensis]
MADKKHFNLSFIKNRREELSLTNQEMAEKLGYKNGSTYLKYENGTYLFKADTLPDLALALDCEIKDFFT